MVYLRREPEKTIKRGTPIALLLFVLVSAVIFLHYDLVSDQIALLMSYQRPGLRRWGESFVSTFFFQIHPFITIAAVYSIYCAFRRKDLTYVIIIYLIVLMILLWIERIRYIIPLFPMLTLLASYGLREVRDREIKRFILFCIVASSLILAIAAYFPFLQRTSAANIKNAARFMSSLDVKNIEVFTLPQERSVINPAVSIPILDLFTDKGIIYDMEPHSDHDLRRVRRSSLRFTWEYRNPRYYRAYDEDAGQVGAIVIISASPEQSMPDSVARRTEQYRNCKIFKTFTGYFRYRTILTVFYE
jgi:hypothetical protein